MATKRRATMCAYCGKHPATENEHVFPESWYPDTTPANVEKLTVPSCGPCNDMWSRQEERFAFDVFPTLDPQVGGVHRVVGAFLRSLNAQHAKDAKDARKRIKKANALLRTMAWLDPFPGSSRVPVRLPSGIIAARAPARSVSGELRRRIAEKLIRGFHYAETKSVLPPALNVMAMAVAPGSVPGEVDREFWALTTQLGADRGIPPGFMYGRMHTPTVSAWRFVLWEQVAIFAMHEPGVDPATIPPDAQPRSRPLVRAA